MKDLIVTYTGTWTTVLQVEDDVLSMDSPDLDYEVEKVVNKNSKDFDFQDGGAWWELTQVEIYESGDKTDGLAEAIVTLEY